MTTGTEKAVFWDKDGTLIPDVPYNVNPDLIELQAGAGEALQRLKKLGYKLIVISNQSGIARGYFTADALPAVGKKIQELLEPYGVQMDNFYYCPHGSDDHCDCRKPRPGMLLQAAEEHAIDLKQSWMIGDVLNDVEAGNRAGCQTILFDNTNKTEKESGLFRQPDFIAPNLKVAADIMCAHVRRRGRHERAVSYNH